MANIFAIAMGYELGFENYSKEMSGYERKTTFVSDLVLAELVSGVKGVKDTYKRVTKSWLSDLTYYTEFVMALNWLCWARYNEGKTEISKLYSDLFYEAKDALYNKFEGDKEAISYIFNTLD